MWQQLHQHPVINISSIYHCHRFHILKKGYNCTMPASSHCNRQIFFVTIIKIKFDKRALAYESQFDAFFYVALLHMKITIFIEPIYV
jgi:hypothetical protein